jgi:cobalt-zinc-cadmium efflux system outer membrane protein
VVAVPQVRNYLYSVLLMASAAGAAESDNTIFFEDQLTEKRLVTLVLHLNPGIAELSATAMAAASSIDPAGSFDDPEFSYAFAPRTFGREGQGLNQKIELSQKIPWPGTLDAREKAAQQLALAANEGVQALRLHIAALARGAYAEWYFAHRALEIHESTHELLGELHSVAETRYAAGLALQQDVLQVELEQLHLRRHGLLLTRQQATARAQINALLNFPPESPLPEPGPVSIPERIPPLEVLQDYALQAHPELLSLDARIASHQAQVTVAEKALWPDLRFMAGYNSLWDEADKRPIVGISINVPLNRSKRKAEVDRANWEVRRTQSRLANQRAQLLGQLARTRAEVIESLESVALYENSLLPLADEFLDAALADYKSGAGDFLSVIAAEKHKLTAAEELERNRADYIRRAAELDRWAGNMLFESGYRGSEVNYEYQ